MENIYTIASSSSSTTYGNIMTVIKELIIRKFPTNYFKDVFVNSEIAYTNIRRRLGRNTLNEMAKLERPFMNINPQVQPPNGDLYLYDIPLTKNFDDMEYGIQKNTLFPIIKNSVDHYTLNYKLNRDQIQFEMTITVDTLMQQLDLYKYMVNHFVWERPFTVKTSLESMIPREMVDYMGRLSNININAKDNQVASMLHSMNTYAKYPITYKMRNGTALDEFFMYYNAEVLVNFTDLTPESVSRKGMADDFYQITFRATVDFNLPGVYVLTGNYPRPEIVNVSLDSINNDGSHDLIPLYTINNLYAKYASLKNGFLLYTSTRFQTECDRVTKKDSLDISVLFENNQLRVIKTYIAEGNPINTLLEVLLIRDGEELTSEWKMNWNRMEIEIDNADDSATYCAIIYINNTIFNEKITNFVEDKKQDKPSL